MIYVLSLSLSHTHTHTQLQLFPECKYKQTEVCFKFGGESFHWSGNRLIDPGFTAIQTWQSITKGPDISIEFVKGQKWDITQVGVSLHY